jgi:pantoate--beta-alanine ligase
MELTRAAADLRGRMNAVRADGGSVALVPTMGALHEGHDSLIERARATRGHVVVSIFLNPLQFGEAEDLAVYPRDEPTDLARCVRLGVDTVWAPSFEEMYPGGKPSLLPDPGPVGSILEGAERPGHFAGVLAAVHRLLDVAGPCTAFFGEKDAQQLFLVRRMVEQLELPVEIVGCPTLRGADGLAYSSRNARLDPSQRHDATCLFLGLTEGAALVRSGERDVHRVVAAIAREVGAARTARLEYAAVVDDDTFSPLGTLAPGGRARALVAARFTSVRLIDNLVLPGSP